MYRVTMSLANTLYQTIYIYHNLTTSYKVAVSNSNRENISTLFEILFTLHCYNHSLVSSYHVI